MSLFTLLSSPAPAAPTGDGTWKLDAAGNLVLNGAGDVATECDSVLYSQARRCSDNALVNLWTSEVLSDLYIFRHSDGVCYKFLTSDTPSGSPGTLLAGYTAIANCSSVYCSPCGGCSGPTPESVVATLSVSYCTGCLWRIVGVEGFEVTANGDTGPYSLPKISACRYLATFTGPTVRFCGDTTDYVTTLTVEAMVTGGAWVVTAVAEVTISGFGVFGGGVFRGTSSNIGGNCMATTSLNNDIAACGYTASSPPYDLVSGGTASVNPDDLP